MATYEVRVKQPNGEWWLVGVYPTKKQASLIAADYRRRGEQARAQKQR